MSTSYACDAFGPQLEITQTFVYVNGESEFLARYTVTNVSTGALSFDAINRGVFSMAGSRQGQGFFDATPPRTIGVFNDQQGSEGGLVANPDTVFDPRTAVYFDRYLDPGLALGATDSFEVVWFFGRCNSLSLSQAGPAAGQARTRSPPTSTPTTTGVSIPRSIPSRWRR